MAGAPNTTNFTLSALSMSLQGPFNSSHRFGPSEAYLERVRAVQALQASMTGRVMKGHWRPQKEMRRSHHESQRNCQIASITRKTWN